MKGIRVRAGPEFYYWSLTSLAEEEKRREEPFSLSQNPNKERFSPLSLPPLFHGESLIRGKTPRTADPTPKTFSPPTNNIFITFDLQMALFLLLPSYMTREITTLVTSRTHHQPTLEPSVRKTTGKPSTARFASSFFMKYS